MEHVRSRAPNPDQALARSALTAVAPYNREIGRWQITATRLLALGRRVRARGSHHPGTAEEAASLQRQITDRIADFEAMAAGLPELVAMDSRVLDTDRALRSLLLSLAEAKSLLEGRGNPE